MNFRHPLPDYVACRGFLGYPSENRYLIGVRGSGLFHPGQQKLNVRFLEGDAAFQCWYLVKGRHLYLDQVRVDCIAASPLQGIVGNSAGIYQDLPEIVPFTGSLLLGDSWICSIAHQLDLRELFFDNGKLVDWQEVRTQGESVRLLLKQFTSAPRVHNSMSQAYYYYPTAKKFGNHRAFQVTSGVPSAAGFEPHNARSQRR